MHLYPWYGKRVLSLSFFLLIAAQALPAEDETSTCPPLTLHVRDARGRAIPDALVIIENLWTAPTNYDGIATIPCKPGLRLPLAVEVTARGFKKTESMVGNVGLGDAEIFLERDATELPKSVTVTARELSERAQKESSVLQQEAMQALQRGDNVDAESLLRRALEMTPSSGSIYNNLGVSFLRRNNIEEAAAWFEKAVKVSPYEPQLLGNLGMIRWLQHRAEESYPIIERAVAGGFSTPAAHYLLGIMLLRDGKTEPAIKELRKSDPARYPMRDLYISIALNLKGKAKDAAKSYEVYLANTHIPPSMALLPDSIESR